MRHFDNKAFPHPVLSRTSDDYKPSEGALQAKVEWRVEDGGVFLEVDFPLSVQSLIHLVDDKKAEFVVEVSCHRTYVRKVMKTFGQKKIKGFSCSYSDKFAFGDGELSHSVITNCYIASTMPLILDPARISELNDDYRESSATFSVDSGSVLAVCMPLEHFFDVEPDKTIGGYFRLVQDNNVRRGQFKIDTDDETGRFVNLCVHERTKVMVEQLRVYTEGKRRLWSGMYFPALIEILHEMKDNFGDHEMKEWFVGINKALEKQTPSGKIEKPGQTVDVLVAVQNLLHNPLSDLDHGENKNG